MVSWADVEEKLKDMLHTVLADAESHEPAIEQAAGNALTSLGAPSEVADAVQTLLTALLNHFKADQAAQATVPETPQG
jgi:hypothetical protein